MLTHNNYFYFYFFTPVPAGRPIPRRIKDSITALAFSFLLALGASTFVGKCVRERERERERERLCVCVWERERESECVSVCVWERERDRDTDGEIVCECVWERERECLCEGVKEKEWQCVHLCISEIKRVFVCVRKSQRKRKWVRYNIHYFYRYPSHVLHIFVCCFVVRCPCTEQVAFYMAVKKFIRKILFTYSSLMKVVPAQ